MAQRGRKPKLRVHDKLEELVALVGVEKAYVGLQKLIEEFAAQQDQRSKLEELLKSISTNYAAYPTRDNENVTT